MRSKLTSLIALATLAASVGPAAAYPAYVAGPVDVHTGPGMRFAIVTTVPAGAPLDVGLCRPGWCQVQFMGGNGFIEAPAIIAGAPPPPVATVAAAPGLGLGGLITAPFDAVGSVFGGPAPAPVAPAPQPPVVAAY
jgi:hypothetical protein